MNGYGPSALGKVAIAPFTTVTEIEFVDKVFVCDPDKDAEQLCDGVTHHWSTGAHTIRVAMITDDTRQLPTEDVRCTALAHELGHVLAANVLGDSDGNHDDVRIWGSSGLIYSAIRTVCPTNTIRRYDGKSLELHVDLPIQELP